MLVGDSSTKWPWQVFNTAAFSTVGQQQAQALTEVQNEWAILFQQANDEWHARTALEREMAAELTRKLFAANAFSDAAAAYQDWMVRHFELMTKDGQNLLADSQTFANSMNRLFPSGGGRDLST